MLTVLAVAAVAAGIYHYASRTGPARRRHARPRGPDARLAAQVRAAIAAAAPKSKVDVRCVNGVVSLRGTIPRAERDLVLAAALAVPGVTQVANHLDSDEPLGDLGPMQSGIATGA